MRARAVLTLGAIALAVASGAMWARIDKEIPLDRAIANVEKMVKDHPKDPQAHYVLGRLYSLGFATKKETVQLYNPVGGLPGFPGWTTVLVPRDQSPLTPTELEYLRRSISHYKQATSLKPGDGLFWLGLGWMYESAIPYAEKVTKIDGKAVTKLTLEQQALGAYRKAYGLTIDHDLNASAGPSADSQISLESAMGIKRILESRPMKGEESEEVEKLQGVMNQLMQKPRMVTPIVFPLWGNPSLDHLLSTGTARFDLEGDGVVRDWPWLTPQTGILCWDPLGTGRITSGSQLFGSRTWWMFFRNGYDALATLDDDGDGVLTGGELYGISVWNDINHNGASDTGEVKSVQTYGINEIVVKQSGLVNGSTPYAKRGIRRSDGSFASTYDWTPTSVRTIGVSPGW